MIALAASLCFLLVYAWLPPSPHMRLLVLVGRAPRLVDQRVERWWLRRKLRTPGQPLTTRLVQTLITELEAGILPDDAFQNVVHSASPESLREFPPTVDVQVWSDVASVWEAARQAGFSMAGAMQRIHTYALIDQEVAREVRANAAAPKYGLASIAVMPLIAWQLGGVMGGSPVRWLLTTPPGWFCLVVGLSLYALAAWVMQRMTKAALK